MIFFEYKNIETEKKELSINIRSNGCILFNYATVEKIGLKKDDKLRFGYDMRYDIIGVSLENGDIMLSQSRDKVAGLFFISKSISSCILGRNIQVKKYIFACFEDGIYIFNRKK